MLQLEIKVLVIENYPDRDFTRAVSPTWGKVDVSRLPWAELSAAQLPLNSLELVDELSCAATKAISMSPPSYSTAPHSSYHRPMPFVLGWLLYQKRQTGNISNRLVPHFVLEVAQMVDPHTPKGFTVHFSTCILASSYSLNAEEIIIIIQTSGELVDALVASAASL